MSVIKLGPKKVHLSNKAWSGEEIFQHINTGAKFWSNIYKWKMRVEVPQPFEDFLQQVGLFQSFSGDLEKKEKSR